MIDRRREEYEPGPTGVKLAAYIDDLQIRESNTSGKFLTSVLSNVFVDDLL